MESLGNLVLENDATRHDVAWAEQLQMFGEEAGGGDRVREQRRVSLAAPGPGR